jgi:hypothetical protein
MSENFVVHLVKRLVLILGDVDNFFYSSELFQVTRCNVET